MSPREERKSVGGRGNAPEYKEGRSGKSSTTRSSYWKPRKSEWRPERDFWERTGARNSSFDRDEKPAKRGFSTRREDKAERYAGKSERPERWGFKERRSVGTHHGVSERSERWFKERRSVGTQYGASSPFDRKEWRKDDRKFGKSSSSRFEKSYSKSRSSDRDGAKLNELEERVARLERLLDTLG